MIIFEKINIKILKNDKKQDMMNLHCMWWDGEAKPIELGAVISRYKYIISIK